MARPGSGSLNKQQYLLIAGAVLVGGPLLANVLADHLPGHEQLQPIELAPPPAPDANPLDLLPKPQQAATMQAPVSQGQAPATLDGATLSTAPMLDTSGISTAPVEPGMAAPVMAGAPMPQIAGPIAAPASGPFIVVAPQHPQPSSARQFREGPQSR